MTTATTNFDAMVKVITSATTPSELAVAIAHTNEIMPIDAKLAYQQANTGKLGNEARALSAIFKHIAGIYENTDKLAGVSTIYNVIDARIVRKVKFTKKLAYNLQSSKALAQFVALTTQVLRSEHTCKVTSVLGNTYECNRNGYHTETVNAKTGKTVKVRKAQYSEASKAIAQGNASSITSAPTSKQGKRIAQIAGQLISGIVKPLAIEQAN